MTCSGDVWHGDCVFAGVKHMLISTHWAATPVNDHISKLMLVDEQTCSMLTHTWQCLSR